jgi:hypothetical protein
MGLAFWPVSTSAFALFSFFHSEILFILFILSKVFARKDCVPGQILAVRAPRP